MKLFISWSGTYSRKVAGVLKRWIPGVLQSVDVFYSPDDIGKGENWNNRLSKELEECNYGVICLTPENVAAPWIHFEAGSLAKAMDSRVSALMLGINTSDVKGPLSRFQNTRFEEKDVHALIRSINDATEHPLSSESLTYVFNIMWPHLKQEIEAIQQEMSHALPSSNDVEPATPIGKDTDNDILQEILHIVRKLDGSNTDTSEPKYKDYPYFYYPTEGLGKGLTWMPIIEAKQNVSQNKSKNSILISDLGPTPDAVISILTDYFPRLSKDRILSKIRNSSEFHLPSTVSVASVVQTLRSLGATVELSKD